MIDTNVKGLLYVTRAVVPGMVVRGRGHVMNMGSTAGELTYPNGAVYCATKAAIHSYTLSLRYQLRETSIEVLELVPPYVATDLMGGASDSRAMPLDRFIAEVMKILKTQPTPAEICVDNVKGLRFAAESGKFDAVFKGMNAAMADVH